MFCSSCGNLASSDILQLYHPCRLEDGEPCSPCRETQELETLISETKKVLEEMIGRHRELRTRVNEFHCPIINRIPPEITASIFEFCVPTDDAAEAYCTFPKSEICSPLELGAVCRAWRQLAWLTPRLWNTIAIHIKMSKYSAQREVVQEWLARSGQLPLSIYIEAPSILLINFPLIQPLITVINEVSSRWRHLDLNLPPRLTPLFYGDSGGVSILQRLRVRSKLMNCEFRLRNPKHIPNEVSISPFNLEGVKIQWSHVIRLYLGSPDVRNCIQILQYAPLLKSCKFSSVTCDVTFPDQFQKRIIHPQLQTLDFEGSTGSGRIFFDNVTLPALENLTCHMGSKDPFPADSIGSFFERSSSPLTTLSIVKSDMNSEDISRLLRATSSLRNMQFRNVMGRVCENFARLLAGTSVIGPSIDMFLPALETVNFIPENHLFWDVLPDMFGPLTVVHNARRRPLRQLEMSIKRWRKGQLQFNEYIDLKTTARLLDLKRTGIVLNIRYVGVNNDLLHSSMVFHGIREKD